MAMGARNRLLLRGASRIPGLKRLPLFKLLSIAEIALLARDHVNRLTPEERRRAFDLVRLGRGRKGNLTAKEREELAALVAKAEPRLFAGLAADKLSPVPLPKRFTHGSSKAREPSSADATP